MKLRAFVTAICVVAIMTAGFACSANRSTKAKNLSKVELLNITHDYLQTERPTWLAEITKLQPILTEHPKFWEVTFQLPDGMAGGVPVVEIDKASGTVRRAYHTQ